MAQIQNVSVTFANGNIVTAQNLNDIIALATLTAGAVHEQTAIQLPPTYPMQAADEVLMHDDNVAALRRCSLGVLFGSPIGIGYDNPNTGKFTTLEATGTLVAAGNATLATTALFVNASNGKVGFGTTAAPATDVCWQYVTTFTNNPIHEIDGANSVTQRLKDTGVGKSIDIVCDDGILDLRTGASPTSRIKATEAGTILLGAASAAATGYTTAGDVTAGTACANSVGAKNTVKAYGFCNLDSSMTVSNATVYGCTVAKQDANHIRVTFNGIQTPANLFYTVISTYDQSTSGAANALTVSKAAGYFDIYDPNPSNTTGINWMVMFA